MPRPGVALLLLVLVGVALLIFAAAPTAHAAPNIVIRGACDPQSFRPNEPTIVICEMEVENTGDAAVPEARIMFSLAPGIALPSRFFFFSPGGNPPGVPPPSIELGTLEPGGVRNARAVMLLENATAGRVGGSAIVMEGAKGTQYAQAAMSFDVRADVTAPSRALEVELIMEESGGNADDSGPPYATISVEVHNRSAEAIRDIVVRHIAPADPAVTWMSSATEVPGVPPGFRHPTAIEYRTVEWRISVLEAGESRYFHGLIEKDEPVMVTHSVLATGTDAVGEEVMAGAAEQWAYDVCNLGNVDCIRRPTATAEATSTAAPRPVATDEVDIQGDKSSDGSSWPVIALLGGGGGVLFLGVSAGYLALRRRG